MNGILEPSIFIVRHLKNFYYVGMFVLSLIALYAAYRTRLFRFSMLLYALSASICLLWELALFSTDLRGYNYLEIIELFYHALTEAGPGLIMMALTAHIMGIIDLSRFKDGSGGAA